MGACTWNRYEQVQREGGGDAPHYALRITQGESRHPGDYPSGPDGVAITWDTGQVPAEVRCSRTTPYASMDDQGGALPLNPQGVAGVEQGIANLYFATCHGEYGDDGALAEKFGYDLR